MNYLSLHCLRSTRNLSQGLWLGHGVAVDPFDLDQSAVRGLNVRFPVGAAGRVIVVAAAAVGLVVRLHDEEADDDEGDQDGDQKPQVETWKRI